MQATATIIDLNSVRRARKAQAADAGTGRAVPVDLPMMLVWVPVWAFVPVSVAVTASQHG